MSAILKPPWGDLATLEAFFRAILGLVGPSWDYLRAILNPPGACQNHLGATWNYPGPSQAISRRFVSIVGSVLDLTWKSCTLETAPSRLHWRHFSNLETTSGSCLPLSKLSLGPSWGSMGPLGIILGPSWATLQHFKTILGPLGTHVGLSRAIPNHFRAIRSYCLVRAGFDMEILHASDGACKVTAASFRQS